MLATITCAACEAQQEIDDTESVFACTECGKSARVAHCKCGWAGQVPEEGNLWICPKCSAEHPATWRGFVKLAVCPKTQKSVALTEKLAGKPAWGCPHCHGMHRPDDVPVGSAVGVSFGYAKYLGGHSTLGQSRQGNLYVTPDVIGIGMLRPKVALIPLSNVASIEVTGGQVAKSKIGAVVGFGVLGGLAAKGAKNESAVIVRTKDDETAYYTIDKQSPVNVRARITPVLKSAGIPFVGEPTVTPPLPQPVSNSGGVADELAKLAALRDQGVLTEDEFIAQKRKLLSQ